MATHSSFIAWEIPCTEEPGGLESMRSESDATEKPSIYIDKAQNLYNHFPAHGYTGCF